MSMALARLKRPLALAALLVLALAGSALGADGDLDPSFSGDGTVLSQAGALANAIAIQPDGRIVEVGTNTTLHAFAFHDFDEPLFPGVSEAIRELRLDGQAHGHLFVWRKPGAIG
jgi:hypothetical protein